MSDNDLLAPVANNAPTIDENKDYLSELVGEGRPYKDHAALAKAVVFKEAHIKKVEAENAIAREELTKRVSLQDVLDKMEALSQARPVTDNRPPVVEPSRETPAGALDPNKVSEIVSSKLSELRESERRTANVAAVRDELVQRFGASFDTVVKSRLSELGIGEKFANDLARTEPKAFLALFPAPNRQAEQAAFRQATPPESVYATPRGETAPTGKKFADYMAIYKKDPGKFLSPAIQREIDRESQRQGPAFYEK